MLLLKSPTTRKRVIFLKLFFVNYVMADTRISLQHFIWLKSKTVKIYSVVKKCKVTFGFKFTCINAMKAPTK